MFIDMIREIVKQVKQNPKQMPVVQIPQKYRQVSSVIILNIYGGAGGADHSRISNQIYLSFSNTKTA